MFLLLLLFGCESIVELERCAQGDRKGITRGRLLRPKGDDGRQPVMPCDADVYTSGDDKVKSLGRV